ncbi:hypothetical protein M8J76_004779 [Diaphorina citri]|nr:hypothetical protein M8J76_004779 [Diaphorina citri]
MTENRDEVPEDQLTDANFFSDMDEIQKSAFRLKEHMESIMAKIETSLKSKIDPEEIERVSALQSELTEKLDEYEKTVRDFQSRLIGISDSKDSKAFPVTEPDGQNREEFNEFNPQTMKEFVLDITENIDRIVSFNIATSKGCLEDDSVKDHSVYDSTKNDSSECIQDESVKDISYSSAKFSTECLEILNDPLNENFVSLDSCEDIKSNLLKEFDKKTPEGKSDYSQSNMKKNMDDKNKLIEEQKKEVDQTLDELKRLKEENKNILKKINQINNEPSVLVKSITQGILPLSTNAQKKYEEELDRENEKIFKLIEKNLIRNAVPQEKSDMENDGMSPYKNVDLCAYFKKILKFLKAGTKKTKKGKKSKTRCLKNVIRLYENRLKEENLESLILKCDIRNLEIEYSAYENKIVQLMENIKQQNDREVEFTSIVDNIKNEVSKCQKISDEIKKRKQEQCSPENLKELETKLQYVEEERENFEALCKKIIEKVNIYTLKIDRLLLINENINTIDTVGDEEPLLIKIREYEKEIEEISNAEPQVEQLTMKLTAAYENRKPIIEQIEEVKQDIAAIRKKKSSLSSKELHEKIESLKKEMLNELDHLRAKIDNVYNESNLSHQEEMPCEASISVDESIRKGDE